MPGNHRSARRQSPRLPSLLVLAAVSTFVATLGAAQNFGPEIITYGDCPNPGGQRLPYLIQTPFRPPTPNPPSCEAKPIPKQSYGYNIDGLDDGRGPPPDLGGDSLPVSIQRPVLPPSPPAPTPYNDPLRGRSYGVGVQPIYNEPQRDPSLGEYNFGVQTSVPQRPQPGPSAPYEDPFRVQIQPGPNPNQGPALWGPLPIAGIERPPISRNGPGQFVPEGPSPRLTGLTSKIDRLLLPADCPLPMDGQGSGPGGNGPLGGAGYPGGNGPFGGAGYPGGNGPFGGAGYPGGNGPFGGAGYPRGNGPMGGAGYPGGNGPMGGASYPGGNGPFGGAGYPGGNGPFGGAGYPGGRGPFGRGGSSSCN